MKAGRKLPVSAFRIAWIVLGGAIVGFAGADAVGHKQAWEPPESETVVYMGSPASASSQAMEVSDLKARNRRLEALVKVLRQRQESGRPVAGQ